tara:strand:+ start:12174 stop:12698 length:525 start_codon:yes stop_codon:yes gene_type:complete
MNREQAYEEYIEGMIEAEEVLEEADKVLKNGEAILDGYWDNCKTMIRNAYEGNYEDEDFLCTIWGVSVGRLEHKEVSVIVDRNDKLFISKGTSSFVDYEDEDMTGMKIPFKCWIHTHPSGTAYFSSTDWNTINAQLPILDSAIVLGDMERMKWWKSEETHYLSKTNLIPLDSEE